MKFELDLLASGFGVYCSSTTHNVVTLLASSQKVYKLVWKRLSPRNWFSYVWDLSVEHIDFSACVSSPWFNWMCGHAVMHVNASTNSICLSLNGRTIRIGYVDWIRETTIGIYNICRNSDNNLWSVCLELGIIIKNVKYSKKCNQLFLGDCERFEDMLHLLYLLKINLK